MNLPQLLDIEDSKKAIVAAVAVLGVFIAGSFAVNFYKAATADKTPIVSISATNKKAYGPSDRIEAEDFSVIAKHKDGGTSNVDSEDIKLSRKKVSSVGSLTPVTVTLKNGPSCSVSVRNKRSKIAEFKCGRYNLKDVAAILYSNEELHFSGRGEVSYYSDGNAPWLNSDEKTDIKSVTFDSGVKISDMSGYFSGIETLTYVDPLPNSVISIESAFKDCTGLKNMPDISKCHLLKNTKEAFSGCTALKRTSEIPEGVTDTQNMFEDCTSLYKPASFAPASLLNDATEMYSGCINLTSAGDIPKSLKVMDSMFDGCSNISRMPVIPKGVTSMDSTFSGCTMMSRPASIPKGVKTLSGCFEGCHYLSGTLKIDANAEDYGSMFSDAVTSTKVNLIGNSKLLNDYAYTSDKPEGHIFVKGRAAKEPE